MAAVSSITTPTATLTTSYGSTTISGQFPPTPIACGNQQLNGTIIPPDISNVVIIQPVTNQTLGYMQICCRDSSAVIYLDGCAAYCATADKAATDQALNCFQPNGLPLDGITAIGSQSRDDETSSSAVSTPTTTASTSTTSATGITHTNGAIGRSSRSILVDMAIGALAIGWLVNGFV